MTWSSALERHPYGSASIEPDFWETFLAENPQVLHRLLADIYSATYGTEKPPSVHDLWELMSVPQFSTKPFGEAVFEVMGTRSIRWLARQVGMAHEPTRRLLIGARPIVMVNDVPGSMKRLEAFARALSVHPSYFVEWRRLWIMSLIDVAFTSQPSLSIGVFRRYADFDGRPRPEVAG